MRFGSMDFTNKVIGDFEGDLDEIVPPSQNFFESMFKRSLHVEDHNHQKKESNKLPKIDQKKHINSVSSRDAKLHHL